MRIVKAMLQTKMADFRRRLLGMQQKEDDASIFGDGFVLEEFQSGGESDSDSSVSLDEPNYTPGDKRKAAAVNSSSASSSTHLQKLGPKKNPKKRVGRKAAWPDECIDEVIDIICESDYYRKKLIFTNNKSFKNSEIYEKVVKEATESLAARGKEFPFTSQQVRTKFKSCVAICKKAAMLRQTASGIENFIDSKGYSKWFKQLYHFVQSRDSCQPDLGIEPSATAVFANGDNSRASSPKEASSSKDLYVPKKAKQKKGPKIQEVLEEAVKAFNKAVEQDISEDILNFMKEENEQARQHDREIMQMQMEMFSSFLSSPLPQPPPTNQPHLYSSPYPNQPVYHQQQNCMQSNEMQSEALSAIGSAIKNYSELQPMTVTRQGSNK